MCVERTGTVYGKHKRERARERGTVFDIRRTGSKETPRPFSFLPPYSKINRFYLFNDHLPGGSRNTRLCTGGTGKI